MSASKSEILYDIIFELLPNDYNKPLIDALGELGELAETAEAKDAEIAALREALEWVDVNETRPPTDGYYLVACEGGNVARTFYCQYVPYFGDRGTNPPTRKHCGKYGKYFELAWEYDYKITHWMPMPKAPTKALEKQK